MLSKGFSAIVICSMIYAGCAGRGAQKIDVVQSTDFNKDCSALQLETKSNDDQIKALIVENAEKQGKNVAVAAVGVVLFWPALFALDLKGAAKAEFEALIQRNKHLASVAANQGCPGIKVKTLDDYKKEIAEERKQRNKDQGVDPQAAVTQGGFAD